jgi:hypothetical protein
MTSGVTPDISCVFRIILNGTRRGAPSNKDYSIRSTASLAAPYAMRRNARNSVNENRTDVRIDQHLGVRRLAAAFTV